MYQEPSPSNEEYENETPSDEVWRAHKQYIANQKECIKEENLNISEKYFW